MSTGGKHRGITSGDSLSLRLSGPRINLRTRCSRRERLQERRGGGVAKEKVNIVTYWRSWQVWEYLHSGGWQRQSGPATPVEGAGAYTV